VTAVPSVSAHAALRIANLRDLGGIRVAWDGRSGGGAILPERLFRASSLAALSPNARARLTSAVGPGDCVDLRSEREMRRDGGLESLVALGWRWHRFAIDQDAAFARGAGEEGEDPYVAAARAILAIEPRGGAVIVSCALGKDRTGRVVALLLSWLGAAEGDIVADYLASNAQLAREAAILPPRFRGEAGYSPVAVGELLPWLRALPGPPDALRTALAKFLIAGDRSQAALA
jgi:protein-tyrosine phosphatase